MTAPRRLRLTEPRHAFGPILVLLAGVAGAAHVLLRRGPDRED